jgi:hypothetical protein
MHKRFGGLPGRLDPERRLKAGLLKTSSLVFTLAAMTGCHSSSLATVSAQPAQSAVARQLIIKFKPGALACDADGIAQLSSATRVPLEYVRPMSGDACVVRQLSREDNFLRDEELLKQHPAIEWLQEDARKKAL